MLGCADEGSHDRIPATIAALAILAAASPGAAAPRPIHPYRVQTGERVRLWTPPEHGGFEATNATVTAVDSTGFTVVIKDRTELVAFTDLARMEVRRGWRYLRRAALLGLVVGATAGVLAEDGGDEWDKVRRGRDLRRGGGGGGNGDRGDDLARALAPRRPGARSGRSRWPTARPCASRSPSRSDDSYSNDNRRDEIPRSGTD